MIRTLIWRKYRVKLSLASVGRLLAQLGLSCQRPLAKAFEQNPSLVEQWVKSEYPKIRAQANREGAEIFFAESGIRSDFHAGNDLGTHRADPCGQADRPEIFAQHDFGY